MSWGSNLHNKVSAKSDEYVDVATQVELSENTALTNVVKIAAGESHALALTADGKVYAWGGGEKGQRHLCPVPKETGCRLYL